jgi:hypothetical protein
MKKQKQDLISAVQALGVNPTSLAEFLRVHIDVSEAVTGLAGVNSETERAINEAKLMMYILQSKTTV